MNSKKRPSASIALQHKWFKDIEKKCKNHDHMACKPINQEVMARLQRFKRVSILKRAAMNVLVKIVDREKIRDLK